MVFVLSGTVAVCVCVCVCVWIYGGSSLGSVAPEVCLLLTACQCVELKKCCGLALILGEAACSGCRPSENEGVILYIYYKVFPVRSVWCEERAVRADDRCRRSETERVI